MWKSLFIMFILIGTEYEVNCQSEKRNCFEVETMRRINYEPSSKGVIRKDGLENNVEFKVNTKIISNVLRNRFERMLTKSIDTLTLEDQNRIEYAISKYNVAQLLNFTDTALVLPTMLGRLTIIQEAKDSSKIWRPIEINYGTIWCNANHFDKIVLNPNEYIEIYAPKYCGDYFTKLRMKLKTKNGIITSKEYDGYVNLTQFDFGFYYDNNKGNGYDFIERDLIEEKKRMELLLKE